MKETTAQQIKEQIDRLQFDDDKLLVSVEKVVPGNCVLNHNYPTTNNLTFQDADGNGIPDAKIYVYLGLVLIGTSTTDENGKWESDVAVVKGNEYTVKFDKPGYDLATTIVTIT